MRVVEERSMLAHSWISSDYALACIDAYKAYGVDPDLQKADEFWATIKASQLVSSLSLTTCNHSERVSLVVPSYIGADSTQLRLYAPSHRGLR